MIEVLMVIAVVVLLAALYVTMTTQRRPWQHGPFCSNNLKQVGIAFRIWAGDNGDKYPMQVSVTNGGTMEFVGSAPDTFRHFEVMSNELNTPKILICPNETDRSRGMAGLWSGPSHSGRVVFTGNSNLSYFAGVDAQDIFPQRFLTGDRNLTNGTPITGGLLTVTTNRPMSWTGEMHVNQGYIGLADGSVARFNTAELRRAVATYDVETNRLAMP